MNNNNNNNNNVVKPIPVNTNNNLNKNQDTFLNRERENIVSATIQANNAIDKSKAKNVNNEYKIKKNNPYIAGLFIFIGIFIATLLSMGAIKLMKTAEKYEQELTSTTTTTTESRLEKDLRYLKNFQKVRRYQNETHILMLSPSSFDLQDNKKFYMLITTGQKNIISVEYGTYNLTDAYVELTETNTKVVKKLNVTDGAIVLNESLLNIRDTEMKSYSYNNDKDRGILIINGTPYNEQALFITTDESSTNYKAQGFIEDDTSITLSDGTKFIKNGMNITYNGNTYSYIQ